MDNFEGLGLNPVLAQSLIKMNYTKPTPIQAQAIPVALEGRDVLGSAQTGTGKTAAFSIPLLENLLKSDRGTALVMTPTRELAKQVLEVMHQMLGPKSPIKTAFLIGGEPMQKQCMQLKKRPRLIVGTPGRINDHVERKNLYLDDTRFLVLDEMDRMLDMGFSIQIDRIVNYIPNDRQTLMFSATMPNNIMKMADKYLIEPERISVGSTFDPSKNVKQEVLRVPSDKKYSELQNALHDRNGSVIIFIKTKHGADKMAKRLNDSDFDARAIHGDLQQRKRDRVINDYRQKKFRILVATDVVARGLDIPHIEHVINYDLPQVPEDYIHRIGRTGRAGKTGNALSFLSPQDGRKWHAIEVLMDPSKKSESGPARNDNKKSRHGRGKGKSFGQDNKFGKSRRPSNRDGGGRNEDNKYGKYQGEKSNRDGDSRGEGRSNWKSRDGGDRNDSRRSEGGNRDGNRSSNWKSRDGGDRNDSRRSEGGNRDNNRSSNWKSRDGGDRNDSRRSEGGNRDNNRSSNWKSRDGGDRNDSRRSEGGNRDNNRSSNWKSRDGGDRNDSRRSEGGNRDNNRSSNWKSRDGGDRNDSRRSEGGNRDNNRSSNWKSRDGGDRNDSRRSEGGNRDNNRSSNWKSRDGGDRNDSRRSEGGNRDNNRSKGNWANKDGGKPRSNKGGNGGNKPRFSGDRKPRSAA